MALASHCAGGATSRGFPFARVSNGLGFAVHKEFHEFTVKSASATLPGSKTTAHINCGCREGDIRLTMSRLVLERLRATINKALERMPARFMIAISVRSLPPRPNRPAQTIADDEVRWRAVGSVWPSGDRRNQRLTEASAFCRG